jgi:hypothetical protein
MSMMQQSHNCMLRLGLLLLVGITIVASNGHAGSAPGSNPTAHSSEQNWGKKLPGASRFTVLSLFEDAAVRDDETGLVWEKTVETTEMSWTDARAVCADKNVGGRKGWRLPSI